MHLKTTDEHGAAQPQPKMDDRESKIEMIETLNLELRTLNLELTGHRRARCPKSRK
jgi:hypothetical protein